MRGGFPRPVFWHFLGPPASSFSQKEEKMSENGDLRMVMESELRRQWAPEKAEFVAKAAEFAADMYDRYVATKGDHEPMHHFND